ncbi:MAG: DUF2721 domain-containing protein [Myxococcaceae bacterium]|nr:DUF2721 domain-containing protein [Myxococcaceae bacterium]
MAPGTLQDITHTIQLSVAPVFLLTAIGATLAVLSTRLGRVIDRARTLEADLASSLPEHRPPKLLELNQLIRRAKLVMYAMTSGVVAALLVCTLIGTAFIAYLFGVNLATTVAVLFVLAVTAFMAALIMLLREVFLAIAMLKFSLPPDVKA